VRVDEVVPSGGRVTLAGLRDAVSPLEGRDASDMVPVKPPREVMVIVDVPETAGVIATVAGFVVTVKSRMLKLTMTECEMLPLVAVKVTL